MMSKQEPVGEPEGGPRLEGGKDLGVAGGHGGVGDEEADWQTVRREVEAATGELSGTLRGCCTVTAAQSLLPGVLAVFLTVYPTIHLEIDRGYAADALERLAGEEVDGAVAALRACLLTALITQEIGTTPGRLRRADLRGACPLSCRATPDRPAGRATGAPGPGTGAHLRRPWALSPTHHTQHLRRGPGPRGNPVARRPRLRHQCRPPTSPRQEGRPRRCSSA
jgi:DNA-binding transcriptional LysR family regulator